MAMLGCDVSNLRWHCCQSRHQVLSGPWGFLPARRHLGQRLHAFIQEIKIPLVQSVLVQPATPNYHVHLIAPPTVLSPQSTQVTWHKSCDTLPSTSALHRLLYCACEQKVTVSNTRVSTVISTLAPWTNPYWQTQLSEKCCFGNQSLLKLY